VETEDATERKADENIWICEKGNIRKNCWTRITETLTIYFG